MGILSWILMGLIAGALGKWIMPGKDPGGVIVTILLGIGGAILGGWIGSMLGLGTTNAFDLRTLLFAIVGALLILFLYRQFKKA
ncbi:MAG: GlsB/YeaQ/YmgE family stress response membrane protein [Gemmatimonadales bacterium]